MPSSQKFTNSVRHLKARLQVLRRPMVWGSGLALIAAGYVLSQYWNGAGQISSEGTDSLSNASSRRNPLLRTDNSDFGNSSDFGNLPGLSNDLTPIIPSPTSGGSVNSVNPPGSTQQPGIFNPFAASQRPTSGSGGESRSTINPSSDLPEDSFSPLSRANRSSTPVSPLQSALDRNAASNSQAPSSSSVSAPSIAAPSSQMNPATDSTAGISSSSSATTLPATGGSQFQPYVPRTSPPPGTTGYTLPPSFRTPTNSSSGFDTGSGFSNFSRPQPLPGETGFSRTTQPMLPNGQSQSYIGPNYGQSSGYGVRPSSSMSSGMGSYTPQSQVNQLSAPFSIPRTPPGQAIGGGQINTFSNP